jgi:DinB superfamily
VQADPAAKQDLQRLGVPRVPAVTVGDRVVHGWNPEGYAQLLGVAYTHPVNFAPAELARRLDRILESAERLVRAFPESALDVIPPERKRSLRDLGYHLFRVALSFVDAMDRGELPESWFEEPAPPQMREAMALASYGSLVRGRLQGWFEGAADSEFKRVIAVYYGPQSSHDLLERTTWHVAQHLRQLYELAGRLGVRPPAPLPVDEFRGLPLPEAVW